MSESIPVLRSASESDLAELVAIENLVASHPWSRGMFAESLANHHCQVLRRQGQVIGFVIHSQILDDVELLNIAVTPAEQGKGYGALLLQSLIHHCSDSASRILLEVRVSNFPAIGLYQRYGFVQTGVRKGYYPLQGDATVHGREDAWIMVYEYRNENPRGGE